MTSIVERLLGEQMADGGWNCEQENGSTRGSFHTTINVLEGLLEHERASSGSAENPHQSEMVNARMRDLGFDMDERESRPIRWNTLRAMRVLDRYERGP